MQYLIVAEHPPQLCPGANEQVRTLALDSANELPGLAEKLGVQLLATYVPMTSHHIYVAVEAEDANSVREFAWQGRLAQWNKVEIYQTSTLEEALTRVQEMPTVY
jgi:hypothetical protein